MTSSPHNVELAGLVPWAVSGTMMVLRGASFGKRANQHQSGRPPEICKLTASMPPISQNPLQFVEQFEGSLEEFDTSQRIVWAKSPETRDHFVDFGIVLHGARASIKPANGKLSCEPGEMAQYFQFAQLRETFDVVAQERFGDRGFNVGVRAGH